MNHQIINVVQRLFLGVAVLVTTGCAVDEPAGPEFYTSGSPEADQRAEQRIAEIEQIRDNDLDEDAPRTLYERLGGERGVQLIVNDFVARALHDPRVNWQRIDVDRPGFLRRGTIDPWPATAENVQQLRRHMAQFIAVATGGPVRYEGRDMQSAHEGLRITNSEFDAAVGLLKATLDKLGVATEEQKELLAIIETTRPQIVEER